MVGTESRSPLEAAISPALRVGITGPRDPFRPAVQVMTTLIVLRLMLVIDEIHCRPADAASSGTIPSQILVVTPLAESPSRRRGTGCARLARGTAATDGELGAIISERGPLPRARLWEIAG